jgi:cytochrome c peroxidase
MINYYILIDRVKNTFSIPLLIILYFFSSHIIADESLESMPYFSTKEIKIIQSLSSKNYPNTINTGNHISGDSRAIIWGKQLFFDKRLSGDKKVSCASCHNPLEGWTKHEKKTQLRKNDHIKRHTPHLWGVRYNRWYLWDGRADSLWSQALMSIENPNEMAGNRIKVAQFIINNKEYHQSYQILFGKIPDNLLRINRCNQLKNKQWNDLAKTTQNEINFLFTNIGKVIASFEETIIAKDSPFDKFVEQISNKKNMNKFTISTSAAKGLKIFIGKAACINCHFSPNFSDGEFHNSFLDNQLYSDLGRYNAIDVLLNSPFNEKSQFYDNKDNIKHKKLDYIYKSVVFRKQFKTPSLRNITHTYPYMHTGEFKNLEEVINYYNNISTRIERNNHQEILLKSLNLSKDEQHNLIEFLKTLSSKIDSRDYLL